MKATTLFSVLFMFALLAGCSEPKINAASESELEDSIQKIKDSLQTDKKEEFNTAILTIMGSGLDLGALMSGDQSPEEMKNEMMAQIDGKTADEVISKSKAIIKDRERRQKEQALTEIADLEQKEKAATAAEDQLKRFVIEKSRLYKREDGYIAKPIIELEVVNNTEKAISRAFFEGVVASPGRSVPWIEESFNYSIPGGLEPGESAEWTLAPNMFSGWGTDVPGDAILTVEAYKLEGPGYSIPEEHFSNADKERLDTLRRKYGK